MKIDPWLPVGQPLPDGSPFRRALWEGPAWQIVENAAGGRYLIAEAALAQKWIDKGLLAGTAFDTFDYGERKLASLLAGVDHLLCPVFDCRSPNSSVEALAFAQALQATREIDRECALQDAIYVERYSRLLPGYTISTRASDDVVLGYWLTGGMPVSVTSTRRLQHILSWMTPSQLSAVVEAAGLTVNADPLKEPASTAGSSRLETDTFALPGRPQLESFFNEHVVDILKHRARYKAFGIDFPAAVVLHGPPGCGKTFAVERLVDFLGWPCLRIEASTVASPYIHETSRKVSEVFDQASKSAPSVLIIDEMDAFLSERDTASGQHRVEEVAEFLRRIPEAASKEVLVVAMTNRLDMIDPAILRRGRFDHVIAVEPASEDEVQALLGRLLSQTPAGPIDTAALAARLSGRPLSDVAFVVREAARLAARNGKARLDEESLQMALRSTPARQREDGSARRIGFV